MKYQIAKRFKKDLDKMVLRFFYGKPGSKSLKALLCIV